MFVFQLHLGFTGYVLLTIGFLQALFRENYILCSSGRLHFTQKTQFCHEIELLLTTNVFKHSQISKITHHRLHVKNEAKYWWPSSGTESMYIFLRSWKTLPLNLGSCILLYLPSMSCQCQNTHFLPLRILVFVIEYILKKEFLKHTF